MLIAGSLILGGCASIVSGQNQSLSVETAGASGNVSGAQCRLSNNKGTWFVKTPGTSVVQRSFEDLSIKCEHEGHEPGLTSVKSTTKGMAFGNILFGGLIGAGVDMSTGAAYDYPNLITVKLGTARLGPDGKPIYVAPAPEPVAAGAEWVGTRLTVIDIEPASGTQRGETTFALTAMRAAEVELDDGAIVIRRDTGKLVRGTIGMATISVAGVAGEPGRKLEGTFVPGKAASPPVPVTLVSAGSETVSRGGGSIQLLRFDVSGQATNDLPDGAPAWQRGAPMSGTVLIDPSTGLVVSGEIKCANSDYALRRRLHRVVMPRAVAAE